MFSHTTSLKAALDKIEARLNFMETLFAKIHEIQRAIKKPSRNPTTLDNLRQGVPKI